ncbi:FAD-dependent oxidoreductase [Clostridium sp. KNHs216]|uniref:NAD(P)/FAD-dependent oxidoreductase n=1 Tax=Clostridium sp. KNHs216 TaxID=1550235 RepID=UPI0011515FE9|nr:FAD-dependent oxidoreductase [Clostridium sp. KNHs216]TQI67094.1 pyridine nucleotide-disulfide oxidoreductase [Clostridium sp. KNHs216]
MNYVIIGNSTAAVGCIEGIRSVDQTGKITVISKEPHHVYSRPLISYLLYGKTTRQRMKYRPDTFYEDNRVTPLLGVTVTGVDYENKKVLLDNGDGVAFDRLLFATGSSPFVPPMAGLEEVENQFSFMKLDDAAALQKVIDQESRVLIVGAGLIGLKCAEGICSKVKQITVVDLAPRILPSILDEAGSEIVQKHIEEQGVKFILSDSVAQFTKNSALLKSGEKLEFDALVVAVGVRPETKLAADIGCKVNKGIVSDIHCATNLDGVYAAGDCSESYDITSGQYRVLALLPNAYMQGEAAGINMAGGEKVYDKAIPMNAIGFFGLHIITAGSYDGEAYVVRTEQTYKNLVSKDNLLKGFILIGDVARAGIYTSLIRERTPLDTVDYELIKEKPQLMAFTASERAVKLGGAKE